jgi:transposase-like protein
MPITPTNPFKGRHYAGEVILLAVRWYLSCMALRATKADENAL